MMERPTKVLMYSAALKALNDYLKVVREDNVAKILNREFEEEKSIWGEMVHCRAYNHFNLSC